MGSCTRDRFLGLALKLRARENVLVVDEVVNGSSPEGGGGPLFAGETISEDRRRREIFEHARIWTSMPPSC